MWGFAGFIGISGQLAHPVKVITHPSARILRNLVMLFLILPGFLVAPVLLNPLGDQRQQMKQRLSDSHLPIFFSALTRP